MKLSDWPPAILPKFITASSMVSSTKVAHIRLHVTFDLFLCVNLALLAMQGIKVAISCTKFAILASLIRYSVRGIDCLINLRGCYSSHLYSSMHRKRNGGIENEMEAEKRKLLRGTQADSEK